MAKTTSLFVLAFFFFIVVHGLESECNKVSFIEQILDKVVRFEFKIERMSENLTTTHQAFQDIASEVEEELSLIRTEKDQMKADLDAFKASVNKKLRKAGPSVTYIRWGRTICPNESTTVYSGYASGSYYTHNGGTSNTICLPTDPQSGNHHAGYSGTYIYNAEYQSNSQTSSIFGESMGEQDVPCAVCEAHGKYSLLMIPARIECYDGWTKEYAGYLMTSHISHRRSNMKCVDENPEKITGEAGNNNGELFYFVEPAGTLPDPPYTRGVELACVVCTK